MLDEIDALDFVLAERLGKSLGDVQRLPNAEVVAWGAFLHVTDELAKLRARG